jgi:nucleoid-associated protein YgaU
MDQLEELKNKYHAAFDAIHDKGVRLTHVHIQDNKLFVQGAAPSEEAKNDVWNQIKAADTSYRDLTCDITVDPSLAPPKSQAATASTGEASGSHTYKVQPGDTLSKIAKLFYGNEDYKRIFEANRDKLQDPNKIQAGQNLTIPV